MDRVLPEQTRFVLERNSRSASPRAGSIGSFDGTVSNELKRSLTNNHAPMRVEWLLRFHEVRGGRHGIRDYYEPVDGKHAAIGEGAFGEVRRYRSVRHPHGPGHSPGMHEGEPEEFAVKFIQWTTLWNGWLRDTAQEELVHREMKMLLILDNPFIIRVREWFEDYRGIYIVMEVCEGGSFQDLLEEVCEVESREDRISQYQSRLRRHFREITYALQYLHSMKPPIAHCDLKPENALLTTKDPASCVKLIDFGLVSLHNKRESFSKWGKGTQIFMAPEQFLFAEGKFTTHIDIWALGVIFGWTITALELGSLQHAMLEKEDGKGWEPTFQDLYHAYQPFLDLDVGPRPSEAPGRGTPPRLQPKYVSMKSFSNVGDASYGASSPSTGPSDLMTSQPSTADRPRQCSTSSKDGKDNRPPRDLRWNRELFGDHPISAHNLADRMLAYPPQARWSARKILTSDWVRAGNREDAENQLLTQESIFMNMRVYPHLSKFEQIITTMVAQVVSDTVGEDAKAVSVLRAAFQDFDTNGDGMLDKEELLEAFSRGLQQHAAEGKSISMRLEDFQQELELLFFNLKKPMLSYTEWLAATMGCTVLGSEEAVNSAFESLDAESKGYISRDDLIRSLGNTDAQGLLRRLKKEQTGTISYEEFNALAHRAASKRWKIACTPLRDFSGAPVAHKRSVSTDTSSNSFHFDPRENRSLGSTDVGAPSLLLDEESDVDAPSRHSSSMSQLQGDDTQRHKKWNADSEDKPVPGRVSMVRTWTRKCTS